MMPHLHFSRSIAIPGSSPISSISPSNRALQVILCLPLPLLSAPSKFLQALTQSSTSFRSTCPNHLNLLCLITSTTPSIQNLLLSSTVGTLSLKVTSQSTHPPKHYILISLHPLFILDPYCPGLTGIHHHTLYTRPVYGIPYPSASGVCLF